ncbi:GTPase HflX [Maritalea mediterranea]|uniref:GTPase HflX n=1 Tax=Maritalea mediterranea TaxID=2909667 RepID=A0ABS9E6L0_9HYPH|nr:GTPase HflX [Maritalea mediterranea]MCF4098510.1 GTPase HflX [Maritalea mediterranea]
MNKSKDNPLPEQQEGVEFARGPKAFVDRRAAPTRAMLVTPDITKQPNRRTIDARKAEFEGLAEAINLVVVQSIIVSVREIKPATFIGGGHVEAIAETVRDEKIKLVLLDCQLSPIQQRNLEKQVGAKVLDRTALILEIFGERAATREGVLQVELAHLNYQKGRLVRSWTHLERQRGGLGFVGGPGETQIEADRRQLQERITLLTQRLNKVKKTRTEQRKARKVVPHPIISLVGYTNAGKSTLFNCLTGASAEEADMLFATLDTTVRRRILPHKREVVFSDTVGFIADLPTDLVAAFRSTLEEVTDAHLVLHVRDVSNPDHLAQAQDVADVLKDLGVTPEDVPFIEVWNKIDQADEGLLEQARAQHKSDVPVVEVSAVTGQNIDKLISMIEEKLAENSRVQRVILPHEAAGKAHWLFENGEVIDQSSSDDELSIVYQVRIPKNKMSGFLEEFGPYVLMH